MQNTEDLISFVINYFWRPTFPYSRRICTKLSIQALKENTAVGNIVLVDGSQQPDLCIQLFCEESSVEYLHMGSELTFAQGYNVGWKHLDVPYIGLMANDIIPPQGTIQSLLEWIRLPDVGCVFPYLSYCDYPGQIDTFVRRPKTCEPTAMTINLNIFKRDLLESVGGIDEEYSGCYNDIILLMKIREKGYRAVLVGNTRVVHVGQMTISQGSNYRRDEDIAKFSAEFSDYWAKHGKWRIKHWRWPLSTNLKATILWWISQNFPSTTIRNWLQWLTMWLEPELTEYPSRIGKRT